MPRSLLADLVERDPDEHLPERAGMVERILSFGRAAEKGAEHRLQDVVGIDAAFQLAAELRGGQFPESLAEALKEFLGGGLIARLPAAHDVLDRRRTCHGTDSLGNKNSTNHPQWLLPL